MIFNNTYEKYKNIKNDKTYYVLNEDIPVVNPTMNKSMILYFNEESKRFYVREKSEFLEKFTKI